MTFHAAKPGLWINPGKLHAGELTTIEIGIPRGAPATSDIGLIVDGVLDALPRRTARSTKFTSGHVVVVGGSAGLTGAPAMTSLAAMRAGAGYVTACVPESLRAILDTQLMEVMTRGLPDEDGSLTPAGACAVMEAAHARGRWRSARGSVAILAACSWRVSWRASRRSPLVLDADGLNAHAGPLAELAVRDAPTVLTPHAGELGAAARDRQRTGRARATVSTLARRLSRPVRSSCSRATTR